MRPVADGELLADIDAGALQRLDFIQQRRWIHHHSVANDGLNARPQNAARNQLEDELAVADEHRVAGVVPALIARHDGKLFREKVHHFTFSFIPPLSTQNNNVSHNSNQNVSLYRVREFAYPMRSRLSGESSP